MGTLTDPENGATRTGTGATRTGEPRATPTRGLPKQARSRVTRRHLLEAAVSCLAEHGWAGSTVAVVAERAGVSRGAAQHHFPTREALFTAAVEYVSEERSTALRELFQAAPAPRPAVVEALVDLYTGALFRAALQLWVPLPTRSSCGPR